MQIKEFVKTNKQYIYAILFDSGVIKVGCGFSAEQRIKQHKTTGIIAGWTIQKTFSIQCNSDVINAEKKLISLCKERCSEVRYKEWFLGLNFDDVVEFAKICSEIEQ